MSSLSQKIDFAVIFSVKNANPNGDPLNGNRPRTDYDGFGEITDVCLKRKIRDRSQDSGQAIFVQSDEKKIDHYVSLRKRAEGVLGKDTLDAKKTPAKEAAEKACKAWFDVRAFGQLFAFEGEKKGGDGVSIPIRGPVSIHSAFSIEPVSITSTQITKSVSGDGDGSKKGSDTMGMKHRVDHAVYVAFGAMSPQLAEKTGFSDADANALKSILPKLFEGDASSARPEGSMAVEKVIWWQHSSKAGQYSSAKVHRTLNVKPDGSYEISQLAGLTPEEIDGF
ncbi:type I-C CRISPR-associated protein Cas7/Csd2 [Rheinheimera muenzenbergensis]|uniref:Type I-C CRISPR-associated protein Cas7/Csd2 n=1 Tax=Rheinheimera muenzenbergensis TaxID=1193628 RepID=A0ABU8C3C9_9GAMM